MQSVLNYLNFYFYFFYLTVKISVYLESPFDIFDRISSKPRLTLRENFLQQKFNVRKKISKGYADGLRDFLENKCNLQADNSFKRFAIAGRDFLEQICNSREKFHIKDMQQQKEISYKRYATAERNFLEKICKCGERFPSMFVCFFLWALKIKN